MSILGWIVLGLIAGFIASKIVESRGQGFFINILLGIIGGMVGGWLFLTSRSYVRPLYTTAVGIGMLVGFVVFIAVGILWMRKLVNVEV